MTSPFSFSQAEVRYNKGDAQIQMKLVDSGFNQMLFTPFMMTCRRATRRRRRAATRNRRPSAGMPGWEKWNTEGKDGSVERAGRASSSALASQGDNVADVKALHAIAIEFKHEKAHGKGAAPKKKSSVMRAAPTSLALAGAALITPRPKRRSTRAIAPRPTPGLPIGRVGSPRVDCHQSAAGVRGRAAGPAGGRKRHDGHHRRRGPRRCRADDGRRRGDLFAIV